MKKLGIENLITDHGFDDIKDWSRVLSVGEQQRLAFVRIILNKPKLIILDEGTSALDVNNVKYIRITNLDDTNSVGLSLQLDSDEDNSAANESCTILLEAGRSFIMGTPDEGIHVDDDSAGILSALTDLESIIINPGSNAGSVEVFVASA